MGEGKKDNFLESLKNRAKAVYMASIVWWSVATAANPEMTAKEIMDLRSGGRDGANIQPKP